MLGYFSLAEFLECVYADLYRLALYIDGQFECTVTEVDMHLVLGI